MFRGSSVLDRLAAKLQNIQKLAKTLFITHELFIFDASVSKKIEASRNFFLPFFIERLANTRTHEKNILLRLYIPRKVCLSLYSVMSQQKRCRIRPHRSETIILLELMYVKNYLKMSSRIIALCSIQMKLKWTGLFL